MGFRKWVEVREIDREAITTVRNIIESSDKDIDIYSYLSADAGKVINLTDYVVLEVHDYNEYDNKETSYEKSTIDLEKI